MSLESEPEQQKQIDFLVISASPDQQWAMWIVAQLEENGLNIFYPNRDIWPGQSQVAELQKVLTTCKRALLILSPAFYQDEDAKALWESVHKSDLSGDKRHLIPVMVKECRREGYLNRLVCVNLAGLPEDSALQELLDGITDDSSKRDAKLLAGVVFPGPSAGGSSDASTNSATMSLSAHVPSVFLPALRKHSRIHISLTHRWIVLILVLLLIAGLSLRFNFIGFLSPIVQTHSSKATVLLTTPGSPSHMAPTALINRTATISNSSPTPTMTASSSSSPTINAPTPANNTSENAYDKGIDSTDIQFGFDPRHSGYNPYESTITVANVAQLRPAWSAQLAIRRVDSTPAIARGVAYVGSWDGHLYAFKAAGCGQSICSPLWTGATGASIFSSPAVANGTVYIGSEDHKLYAFNAAGCGRSTCSPLWVGVTGGFIDSSPSVANGVIYIGSSDNKLYAFKATGCGHSTCSPWWVGITNAAIFSSPAVDSGMVYINSNDGILYAFNASGCASSPCTPVWTATVGGTLSTSPTIANGIIYSGSSNGNIYTFSSAGCGSSPCSPVLTFSAGVGPVVSVAATNGIIYAGSGNDLYAFAAGCAQSPCAPLWQAATGNTIRSLPLIANRVVYILSSDGNLYAFNADGCGQTVCGSLWAGGDIGNSRSSPTIANGVLYISTGAGYLQVFHL